MKTGLLYIKAKCNKDSIIELRDDVSGLALIKMPKKAMTSFNRGYLGSKSRRIFFFVDSIDMNNKTVYINNKKILKNKIIMVKK